MKKIIYLFAIYTTVLLVGCASKQVEIESFAYHDNLVEDTEDGHMSLDFDELDGTDTRVFHVKEDKLYNMQFDYSIEFGDIDIQIRNGKDELLYEKSDFSESTEELMKGLASEYQDVTINIWEQGELVKICSEDGIIKISVIGDHAKGFISFDW